MSTAAIVDKPQEEKAAKRATSFSLLLGEPVVDSAGNRVGRVRDLVLPSDATSVLVSRIIVRTSDGLRGLNPADFLPCETDDALRLAHGAKLLPLDTEHNLLAVRDVLDQQIIDVSGHKVVRVNDLNLEWHFSPNAPVELRVQGVEIGTRGAVRRILRGTLPESAIQGLANRFTPRVIPWHYVNLIETDPARRVHLKIEQSRLQKLHPSDLADILEDLPPAERAAVFSSLDEETAAETLEEVEPRMQRALVNALDSERAADIVEEMDPAAAADLLAELPEARSEAILEEMEPEERAEVEELLEFGEDTAAGRMTLDYLEVPAGTTVALALRLMREFDEDADNLTAIYVLTPDGKLKGVVPVYRLATAEPDAVVDALAEEHFICVSAHSHERDVAEMFDKYNLMSLPVLDDEGKMSGVIHAHAVIGYLRKKR